MSGVFGAATFQELQDFFGSFEKILFSLTRNALRTREMLSDPATVAFLLVTTPAPESLADAALFRERSTSMGLPFGGLVLNRCRSAGPARVMPAAWMLGDAPDAAARDGLDKLIRLAHVHRAQVEEDDVLLASLRDSVGEGAAVVPLPVLHIGSNQIEGLLDVANALMTHSDRPQSPRG